MKVCGFTFIRNAEKYDYPIKEAILSILPLCDHFIIAAGNSDDNTLGILESIQSPKIEIIHTVWDESLRIGGEVLAQETNKAFDAIPEEYDWAFYIQGDEVIHEKYHRNIRESMEKHLENNDVEGLLFNYKHFYGSYDFVGDSRRWYKREIRIVRNNKSVRSFRDAQGFRINDQLIKVMNTGAFVYHYGWVKPPEFQQAKQEYFHSLWHDDDWMDKNIPKADSFDYSGIDSLVLFDETHPEVMHDRIRSQNWHFSFDPTQKNFGLLSRFLYWIEKKTGWRPGEYKNFRLLRR